MNRSEWHDVAEALDKEAIERARSMTPEERVREGLLLFDRVIAAMTAGVRHQFPGIDEAAVQRIVDERLDDARRRDEWDERRG